jgi:peptidylprolyl isomerase
MKKLFLAFFAVSLALTSCKDEKSDLSDGLYAEINTDKGKILLELEYRKAPVTVANFVSLAEGKNPFVSNEYKGKHFYDGLTFHRVVENFMIQGGDPLGNGSGGPGYKFSDEFTELGHDRAGTLSMANAGPGTNGSQFFITHRPTEDLNGRHSVFGYVVTGQDVVDSIAMGDKIESVKIIRVGEAAKRFDAVKTFSDYFANESENQKKQAEEQAKQQAEFNQVYTEKYKSAIDQKLAEFAKYRKDAKKLPSGVEVAIFRKGSGEKPKNGEMALMNYAGFLENGILFDSNMMKIAQDFGKYDPMREQAGDYLPTRFVYGPQGRLVPGFKEAMSQLSYGDKAIFFIPSAMAYGAAGAGGVIPPNANILFEVELLKFDPKQTSDN